MAVCLPLCVKFLLTFFAIVSTELFLLIMSGALYLCECCCFSCNKCCKCPLPGCQLCLKSVYGVVSHTDLSVVCAQKGSFTAPRSLVLLRRAFPAPPQVQKFMPHFFPCAFTDSFCSEFWAPWNLPLCDGLPVSLCPRFPFLHQTVSELSVLFHCYCCCCHYRYEFGGYSCALHTRLRNQFVKLSEKLCWVFDCCYIELIYWWLCLFTGHQR